MLLHHILDLYIYGSGDGLQSESMRMNPRNLDSIEQFHASKTE